MADKLVVGDKVVATFADELAGGLLEVGDGLPAMLMGVRLFETTAVDKTKNISTCKKEKFWPNSTTSYLSAADAARCLTAGCLALQTDARMLWMLFAIKNHGQKRAKKTATRSPPKIWWLP